jgi:hypothetical protein
VYDKVIGEKHIEDFCTETLSWLTKEILEPSSSGRER